MSLFRCLIVVLFVLATACHQQAVATIPVGGIATNFTIINHNTGQPLNLYDYRGSVILLDFWAYWCGPCKASAPSVKTNIVQYYNSRGGNKSGVPVTVISISIDGGDMASVNSYINTYGLDLPADDVPMASWSGGALKEFPYTGVPNFVVINGTTNSTSHQPWQVVYQQSGYSLSGITGAIDSVVAPKPVTTINWQADRLRCGSDGNPRLLWRHLNSGVPDGQVSLWTLNTNGLYQSSQTFGPVSGWTVADLVVSGYDSTPHLVWTNTSGAVSIWNLNTSGVYQSSQTFGPYSGWSYHSLIANPYINQQHLLWQHTSGQVSHWRLNSSSAFVAAQSFGPITGWSMAGMRANRLDGKVRLAWRSTDGSVSVWRLASTGAFEGSKTFGPISGWTFRDVMTGPVDSKPRMLWQNTSGAVSIWRLSATDVFEAATTFGPVTGWSCGSLNFRADNKGMMAWLNTDGSAASFWWLSSAEAFESATSFGPYSGWALWDGDLGAANKTHLLWRSANGSASIWRLSSTGAFENSASFGPY